MFLGWITRLKMLPPLRLRMRLVSYILGEITHAPRIDGIHRTGNACNFPLIRRIERVNLWVSANGCNSLLCHIPWVSSVWKYSEVKSHSTSFPFVWPRVPYSPFFLGNPSARSPTKSFTCYSLDESRGTVVCTTNAPKVCIYVWKRSGTSSTYTL